QCLRVAVAAEEMSGRPVMATYRELKFGRCAHCRRRVLYVRIVEAVSPWLYDLLGGFLPSWPLLARTGISVVRLPWECLDCGGALAAAREKQGATRNAEARGPVTSPLRETATR